MMHRKKRGTLFSSYHPSDEKNDDPISLNVFLEKFPHKEIWRFFVERSRYDLKKGLYFALYQLLEPSDDMTTVSSEHIQNYFKEKQLTLKDLKEKAESTKNRPLLEMIESLDLNNKHSDSLVSDVLNQHQAWLGFEAREPGYLQGVVNGFCMLLKSLLENEVLTLDFIQKLHFAATDNVEALLQDTVPGEFRTKAARWLLFKDMDTRDGMQETIEYLADLEKTEGQCAFSIDVIPKDKEAGLDFFLCDQFAGQDPDGLTDLLWEKALDPRYECFFAPSACDTKEAMAFLQHRCEQLLKDYLIAIAKAETKKEKLTAIFTFLKRTVLHHPFTDGVGRTYSMLLLQYLLLQQNLSPALLFDSNIIPGLSVKELVKAYLQAEKDMVNILKYPENFPSSAAFARDNVATDAVLQSCTPTERDYFERCVHHFAETAADCLKQMSEVKKLNHS